MNTSLSPHSRHAVALLETLAQAAGHTQLSDWLNERSAAVAALLEELLADLVWEPLPDVTVSIPRTAAKRRDANVAALRLLKQLIEAERGPSPKERATLLRYSGWGGVIGRESDTLAIPDDVRPTSWRGLIDEFYTPLSLTQEVWRLMARLVEAGLLVDDPRCLEPSAGIGRFLATAPAGLDWTTVELSKEAARFLRMLFPTAHHIEGSFQEFMRDAAPPQYGKDFDLVVGNPPYAKQGRHFDLEGAAARVKGKAWKSAHAYFTHAAMRRLARGGVLGFVVPLGLVTGTGAENKRLRLELLAHCDWLGAFALPGDLFPGARLGLAFILVRKRTLRAKLGPFREEVYQGRYFETEPGLHNLGGRWSDEGAYREMVISEPNARPLSEMVLNLPGTTPARAKAKKASPATSKKAPPRAKKAPTLSEPHEQRALALGERVRRFRRQRQKNPVEAERSRTELVADLVEWTTHNGAPHEINLVASADPASQAFLSAFDATGALAPVLRDAVPKSTVAFPGDRKKLVDVVRWLSGRYGQANWLDIHRWFKGDTDLYAGANDDEIMIAVWEASGPTLQHRREYLSGDLYARVDQIDAQLKSPHLAPWLVERFKKQRGLLIRTIDPQPIDVIDIDFRHGLVPEECLSDWLTAVGKTPITARWEDGVLLLKGDYLPTEVQDIAAFASRQELYAREGKAKKTRRHKSDLTLKERLTKDEQLLERFNRWLRQHDHWGPHVADLYNRAYRSHVPRAVESEPLPMTRANPTVTLRGHQNNAIRTLTEMRGGIVGHDVGLGKTFTACGLVAWWRQLKLARRPIVVVPKQVITNWLREFERLLPDYDAGAIGVEWSTRAKKYVEDSPELKRKKWHAFASGQYDVLVVTQPAFEALPTRPDTRYEVLRDIIWLQREEKLVDREAAYLKRRIEHQELELTYRWGSEAKRLQKSLESSKAELLKHQDRAQYLRDQVDRAQRQLDDNDEPDQVKKLEKRLKTAKRRLESELKQPTLRTLQAAEQAYEQWAAKTEFERKQDLGLTFEELGCDLLIMDEAHAYKNLFRPQTRYGKSIKYLGSSGGDQECKRCWDLLVKTTHLRQQHDGAGVVLLTATPLKNSPLELYNLLLYVRPQLLEARGIRTHEEFVDRYCGFSSALTLDTTQKLKDALIVDRFTHLDELRSIMDLVVDIRTADDVGLDIPGTKTEMVTVPMDGRQEHVYEQLRAEGRAAQGSPGEAGSSNMLAILRRMDYAALDLRLLDAEEYDGDWDDDYLPPKYAELSKRITASGDCAHIVFVSESRRESLTRCKQALVEHGFEPKRIITMHGGVKQGDRQKIVDGLNGVYATDETGHETMMKAPQYDIIIGNSVMSEGLNLQRRACAIHHVDVPWTPSDLQQRNGRGVRQGNRWAAGGRLVGIYYYLTEQSSDGYRLQLVSGKRGWMTTLLKSSDNDVNNPLAESGLNDDDLILLFADDPESAKAELDERHKKAEAQRLKDEQTKARKRFQTLQVFRERSRRTTDTELAANYDRQAAQLEAVLQGTEDAIFPAELKALVEKVREHAIFVNASGHLIRPEQPTRLRGRLAWIYNVDPLSKVVGYRLMGSPFVSEARYNDLSDMPLPAQESVEWDAAADARDLKRARYVDPQQLPSVAPDLIEAHWDRLIESASTWSERITPLVKDDELQVVPWKKARELMTSGWTVVRPDEEGWTTFVQTPGGAKTSRRRVARQWWGRTAPEPAQDEERQENPQDPRLLTRVKATPLARRLVALRIEEGGNMQARAGFDTDAKHVLYADRHEALEAIDAWRDIVKDELDWASEQDDPAELRTLRSELRAWTTLFKAIKAKES